MDDSTSATFLEILLAILLPPVGVFFKYGCEIEFWICLLFTILGYLPGIAFAVYVICCRRRRVYGREPLIIEFWICLVLTLLGYIPGIIYAIYVIVGR